MINSIKEKWSLSIPTQVTHPENTCLLGRGRPHYITEGTKASRKRKTVYVASSHTTYTPMEGIYSGSMKLWKQEMTLGPNSLSSDPNNCAGFTRFVLVLPWGRIQSSHSSCFPWSLQHCVWLKYTRIRIGLFITIHLPGLHSRPAPSGALKWTPTWQIPKQAFFVLLCFLIWLHQVLVAGSSLWHAGSLVLEGGTYFPDLGSNPGSPHWESGVLATKWWLIPKRQKKFPSV